LPYKVQPPKKARGDPSNIYSWRNMRPIRMLKTKSTYLNLILKMVARGRAGSHGVTIGLSEQLAAIFISFFPSCVNGRKWVACPSMANEKEERKAVHCSRLAFSHTAAK
jgi:hypothetical protein